jgi:protein-tyrosine phosphatase
MELSDTILAMVSPLVKGEVPTPFGGRLFFGRMWFDYENSLMEKELAERKVELIFNLRENHGDFAGAQELCHKIEDHGIPEDKEKFVEDVEDVIESLKHGKNVFVHCFAGKGRTSLALAAILVRLGIPSEEALQQVQELARGPETEDQKKFVMTLENHP